MHLDLPLERLIQLPQVVAGECSYGGVLSALAGELRSISPFDHLDMVILVDDGRDHLCFETPVSTVWSSFAKEPKPTGVSPARSVLKGHVPHILTGDAFKDKRFHFSGAINQPIYDATLRSRIIVPLRVRGAIFGSISISRHSVMSYTVRDLIIGQHCADLIAPYLFALKTEHGRALQYANEADALRGSLLKLAGHLEGERKRLGMDLHDQTIADLSRIAHKLSTGIDAKVDLKPVLAELHADVISCLNELRRIVDDARPAMLELFGFAEAVEQCMIRARSGMARPIRLRFEEDTKAAFDQMNDGERTLIYRIVQEGINNALQHSRGQTLIVRMWLENDSGCIDIEDDGIGGLDWHSPRGVSHMRIRAAIVGARITVTSNKNGGGTRLRLVVPLPDSSIEIIA
ncbi:sensor histidine kinase [Fodinicurvata fenggangensis]|uniref:sensor histidine kinase n=1 Tax=Fodinicurvata fenggangensis TaxID=1121830 RepID=UPI00138DE33B|nr:histidine kinase [Fodinicurvata fenggangensis]